MTVEEAMKQGKTCASNDLCPRDRANRAHQEAVRVEWMKQNRVLELQSLLESYTDPDDRARIDARIEEAIAERDAASAAVQSTPRSDAPVTVGAKFWVRSRSNPQTWRSRKVCVCDASVEELEMLLRLEEEYDTASFWDWEVKRAKIARDSQRGQMAAITRRENERKRKLAVVDGAIDLSDCDDSLFF